MTYHADPSDVATDVRVVAERAVGEDGPIDITSEVVAAAGLRAVGAIEYRSGGIVAGRCYANEVARLCGAEADWTADDGAAVPPGETIGSIRGDLAAILRAERPLLNLLQRACGIATATKAFVDAVVPTDCRILHTRKTAPGLRGLDARAVVAGGGALHRLGLSGAVLIKDNHWCALAARELQLRTACDGARARGVSEIYVEVESLDQVKTASAAGATRLLVDNQTPETFSRWVEAARKLVPDIEMEASGGIGLDTARDYALGGADFISIGALTHSVRAADLALEIDSAPADGR